MSSTTNPGPDAESVQSGIAALNQTADPFTDEPPYPVSGLAMPEGVITNGGSGTRRMWPAETLREATELLEGKSIVSGFHPASPEQAPPQNIVGKITDAGYEDGVGLRFSGEVIDRETARQIDRDYLEVSTRPAIAEETYDANEGYYVVEEVADFLDIGLVDWGAAGGNAISVSEDSAVAALARSAIGYQGNYQHQYDHDHDALQRSEARTPSYSGTRSSDSWPDGGPSLSAYIDGYYDQADADPDDQPSQWGDLPQETRNWISSKTLLGDSDASSADSGISYPVVYPDEDLSESGLESARSMAGHAPSEQAADSIRSVTATLLENEFGHDIDDEANAATAARQMTIPQTTAALQEDGDGEDGDSGDTRLDVWSDFLADMSGSVNVDEVNFDNLHRLLASEIPGADISDVAGALPAEDFDEGFGAADARELISGLVDSDDEGEGGESESEGESNNEDEEEEETESNADWAYQPESAVGALLMRDLELTGTTPDRCKTIKDGASTVDTENDELARSILGLDDKEQTDLTRASAGDDPVAQQATGLSDPAEDDDKPDPSVKNAGDQDFSREDVVDSEDPIGRELFGMPDPAEDNDEPDPTIKDVDRDRDYSGEGLVNAEDPIDRELFGMPDPAEETDESDPTIKNKGDGQDLSEAVIGEDTNVVDREYVTSPGDNGDEDEEEPNPNSRS